MTVIKRVWLREEGKGERGMRKRKNWWWLADKKAGDGGSFRLHCRGVAVGPRLDDDGGGDGGGLRRRPVRSILGWRFNHE